MKKRRLYHILMIEFACLGVTLGIVLGCLIFMKNKAKDESHIDTDYQEMTDVNDTNVTETENQNLTEYEQGNVTDKKDDIQEDIPEEEPQDVHKETEKEEGQMEPAYQQEEVRSKYGYVSSDGKWAVNKSYFSFEENSQKSDGILYSTDVSDQYSGDLVMEVIIVCSQNTSIYLDLNLLKLEAKEYSDSDFYDIEQGSVAKIMYVDNRVKDNSGWILPDPYCYYKIATGVTSEGDIIKKFTSVSLKVDYIDYVNDVIGAYLTFTGPNIYSNTVDMEGYFVADIPFITSCETLNLNPNDFLLSEEELETELSKYLSQEGNTASSSSGNVDIGFLEFQKKMLNDNIASSKALLNDSQTLNTLKPSIRETIEKCEKQLETIEEMMARGE